MTISRAWLEGVINGRDKLWGDSKIKLLKGRETFFIFKLQILLPKGKNRWIDHILPSCLKYNLIGEKEKGLWFINKKERIGNMSE